MVAARWLSAVAVLLGALPALATPSPQPDSCVTCHAAFEGALAVPVTGMQHDVHAAAGLSCSDCHGGDPADVTMDAMDKARGFRGTPSPAEIPGLCGRCHADVAYMRERNPALPTDQLAQYGTSMHGKRLAAGDPKVATCVSCHGVHGILPVANAASPVYPTNVARTCAECHADPAHMAGYGIPTNQFADYSKSVHAELLLSRHDLGAPTCNDCHGNHGASPPGAISVSGVCGQCHAVNRDLFVASPHKPAFERLGLPECVTCHDKHAIQRTNDSMLGTGPLAVCITCHSDGSPGYRAAAAMGGAVTTLAATLDDAARELEEAARAGMEMTDARFELQGAQQSLVQSRNLVHAFSPDKLLEEAQKGQGAANQVRDASAAAFGELRQRRRLVIIPLAAFAVVLVLVVLKLRRLEGRR
jgi:predicted CXXCH cytochrome family protein